MPPEGIVKVIGVTRLAAIEFLSYGGHDERVQSLSCSPEHELFGRSSDEIITATDQTIRGTPAVIAPGWPPPLAREGGRPTDSLSPAGDSSHAEPGG
jgi:hypothetical protein